MGAGGQGRLGCLSVPMEQASPPPPASWLAAGGHPHLTFLLGFLSWEMWRIIATSSINAIIIRIQWDPGGENILRIILSLFIVILLLVN